MVRTNRRKRSKVTHLKITGTYGRIVIERSEKSQLLEQR
jgi:hypothetical protein